MALGPSARAAGPGLLRQRLSHLSIAAGCGIRLGAEGPPNAPLHPCGVINVSPVDSFPQVSAESGAN